MSTAELAALGEVLAADHNVEQGAARLGLDAAGFRALLRSVTDADLAAIRAMQRAANR